MIWSKDTDKETDDENCYCNYDCQWGYVWHDDAGQHIIFGAGADTAGRLGGLGIAIVRQYD